MESYPYRFISKDSLQHFESLNFSILTDFYIEKNSFLFYKNLNYNYPIKYTVSIPDKKVFEPFHTVVSFDNMIFLKNNFPDAFEFYKQNSNIFNLSILNYKSLMENYKLICDMDFLEIYETQISEQDFLKNQKDIIKIAELFNKKMDRCFRFTVNISNKQIIYDDHFRCLFDEMKEIYQDVEFHIDGDTRDDQVHDRTPKGNSFHEEFYIHDNLIIKFLPNSLYFSDNTFYLSINDVIQKLPTYSFKEFSIIELLNSIISTKLQWYQKFITYDKMYYNEDFYNYFKAVIDHIQFNEDWNFIPIHCLEYFFEDFAKFLQYFAKYHPEYIWIDNIGLLKQGKSILPIVSIT